MKKKAEKKIKDVKEIEYTAESIVDLVNKKKDSTAYTELHDQFERHYDLFSLKSYEAEAGHKSYTSPKPRNDGDKVLTGINKANLTWNIQYPEDAPDAIRNKSAYGEKFLTGVLDMADNTMLDIGEPPVRESAAWYSCYRGALGGICLIYVDDNGRQVYDIRSLDPLHMTWEKGADGFVWASYEYPITKSEAKEKWGKDIESDEDTPARVIVFFTRKINAIVLSVGADKDTAEHTFIKDPTPHGLDHVPIFIGFASSMPSVMRKDNQPTLKDRAASVYHSSENTYAPFNEQVSFVMDIAEKSVAGALIHESSGGKKAIAGDPFLNYTEIKIDVDAKEKIYPLEAPKVPQESGLILSILSKDQDQSAIPFPIGYGLDPQAHSGAALSMINDNMRSIYDPFSSLISNFYRWLCKEIISQYKLKGLKTKLNGFDPKGKFFSVEANPDELQDDWYIVVKCEPKLPRDEAGEIAMALQATQPRQGIEPLLSMQTAREKVVKIQDPDAEKTRVQNETIQRQIDENPVYQVKKLAQRMLDNGDQAGAEELLASLPAPTRPGQANNPQGQAPQGQQTQGQGNQQQMMQELQAIAQRLGLPVEQVANMTPQQVQAALAEGA
jgi:hypothetical protein